MVTDMKRILIFSDSHGSIYNCITLIEALKPTAIIHAGDCMRDCEELMNIYPELTFHCVCGNNDFSARFPGNLCVEEEGKKIFITHGHEYYVKYECNYSTLIQKAQEQNADLCVFGHTHVPYTDVKNGMIILNPGSIRYTGTYGVCEIENGKMKTCILEVPH